jgi:TRAP-type C4-dicarboxylate transport system permease small subunit
MAGFIRWISVAGGIVLVALMLFTSLDVTLRFAFNLPIYGAQEIVELGMVLVVALGMAHAGWTGAHIVIDFAAGLVGSRVFRAIDTLLHVIGSVVLGVVAWLSVEEGLDALHRSAATNVLQIPQYPFHVALGVGLGLYGLVLLLQAPRAWRREAAPGASP